jgi:CBS-domain-containing membrane protein
MTNAIERLRSLQAKDIMNRNVVQLSENQTLAEAAVLLHKHGITGAPVVNEEQRCVGVLSSSDFVRKESLHLQEHSDSFRGAEHRLLAGDETHPFQIDERGDELVGSHMSTGVQTVNLNTGLLQVAREMCAEHIHRVLVLDERSRVAGVATTLDVVAALLNVVDECEKESK